MVKDCHVKEERSWNYKRIWICSLKLSRSDSNWLTVLVFSCSCCSFVKSCWRRYSMTSFCMAYSWSECFPSSKCGSYIIFKLLRVLGIEFLSFRWQRCILFFPTSSPMGRLELIDHAHSIRTMCVASFPGPLFWYQVFLQSHHQSCRLL